MIIDDMIKQIKILGNPSAIGLDTLYDYLPESMRRRGPGDIDGRMEEIYEFNKLVIDSISGIACIVKIQSAFYEMYGWKGVRLFYETARYAKQKNLFVIADVKRGDISSTAKAYSKAYMTSDAIDFVTLNPYMGYDAIKPFIEDAVEYDKGIFVLVKTSNASSSDIQDLSSFGRPVYEHTASLVDKWARGADFSLKDMIGNFGYSRVGAVVGATYPEIAKNIRKILTDSYFLVPGYLSQGAAASDAVAACDANGLGVVVNASRSILLSYKKQPDMPFGKAISQEAVRMKNELALEIDKRTGMHT